MKILIAEDNVLSLRLLQKTLQSAGYEVIAVENGKLAKEALSRQDGPRLALLDWVMPEMDGAEVCRAVRKQTDHSYVYLILLTSKESKEDVVSGLESGADDYLTKPFDPEELKARLRTGKRILDLEDKLVEARDEMRFQATHDALTHLLNRGMILDFLNRELARGEREQANIAILLGDLDHFKEVNDMHGHRTGDEVLREVSRRLVASVRPYDYVGRYGGEEFLILLSNCDPRHAMARADQIRQAIESHPVDTASGRVHVTMSLGLLLSQDWPPQPVESLLHEVDTALYAAKAAGRNSVQLAQPPANANQQVDPMRQSARRIR